ncbi:MAG: hypothetical protein ALAOOOJD_04328 [bacterium]|nr:hypothetical protein [bacterium]
MPHQHVADHEHLVFLTQRHELIHRREVVFVRLGMNAFPFQRILRRDAVELLFDQRQRRGILARNLIVIQRHANVEILCKYFFERRPPGESKRNNGNGQTGQKNFVSR